MKKSTKKSKKWNSIHIHCLDKHRNKRWGSKYCGTVNEGHRKPRDKQIVKIICPKNFSLQSNFSAVVKTLDKVRQQSLSSKINKTYIDFRGIESMSLDAALVFVAELDKWNNLLLRDRLRAIDVDKWNPNIRILLNDVGFFELLRADNPFVAKDDSASDSSIRYVKFRTGSKADGKAIDHLRVKDLEAGIGKVPDRLYLYAAVIEAMTNVVHHAYTNEANQYKNWWLSASYDNSKQEIMIMIYDQGVGIPRTLQRNFFEKVKKFKGDHARMIRAAHDLARSKTGESHRGHGLERDVRNYLIKSKERGCHGHYRVLSLHGEYLFEISEYGKMCESRQSHYYHLPGTLIEWKLNLK